MIVLQPSPNEIHHSFTTARSLDLNNASIANYSAIAPQTISSPMYQTSQYQTSQPQNQPPPQPPQQQQQQSPFVYATTAAIQATNNPEAHYAAAAAVAAQQHSRSSSRSSATPDSSSFTIDSNAYYRYDTSTPNPGNINSGIGTTTNDSRGQPSQNSITLTATPQSGDNSGANTVNSINGVNILPPLSEVLQHQQQNQQQNSTSPNSPSSQSQVVPNVKVQQQDSTNSISVNLNAATAQSVPAGFYQSMPYTDVNATYATQADGIYATQASLQQAMANQQQQQVNTLNQQVINQQQQQAALNQNSQIASNIPVVDPRTLPPIAGTGSEIQAGMQLMDASGRRNSSLLINTAGLTVGGTESSPMSANSSTGSPILSGSATTTLPYQSQAAAQRHHQATFLNGHFMAATQSMNNVILQQPQRQISGRRRSDVDGDTTSPSVDRPPKVYSFVPLPGINTKKRPRRRYDEIERHYACNFPSCTKAYGTLNHLNAHVQMQKHGNKRHPSEFKELRKQWRRQKREEEERKASEAAAKQNALLNGNLSI